MFARNSTLLLFAFAVLALAASAAQASSFDAQICFDAADKVTDGGKLEEAEKQAAHEACQRALAATASVVQKVPVAGGRFRRHRHQAQELKERRAGPGQTRRVAGYYFFWASDVLPGLPSFMTDFFM